MIAIISIFLTFILTTIVGNRLVYKWQQRNWLQQQHLLRVQQDLGELKKAIDEMMTLGNARYYRTRKLDWNLGRASEERMLEIKKEYDESVVRWNEKFTILQVKLNVYLKDSSADSLDELQNQFVSISDNLDRYLRKDADLNIFFKERALRKKVYERFSARLTKIFQRLTNKLVDKQKEAYLGKKIDFNEYTADYFSTWYLFKALFKANNPAQSIIGAPTDFGKPTIFRF